MLGIERWLWLSKGGGGCWCVVVGVGRLWWVLADGQCWWVVVLQVQENQGLSDTVQSGQDSVQP